MHIQNYTNTWPLTYSNDGSFYTTHTLGHIIPTYPKEDPVAITLDVAMQE